MGAIHSVRITGRDVIINYSFEPDFPPLTNQDLKEMADELGIDKYEFQRTHWAIKDADLLKALIKHKFPSRVTPKVFEINETWTIDEELLSVMMPFDAKYDRVFETLKNMSNDLRLKCCRVDDIWDHPAIIQDVFSLIYKSRIVVCDCTGRNPAVSFITLGSITALSP